MKRKTSTNTIKIGLLIITLIALNTISSISCKKNDNISSNLSEITISKSESQTTSADYSGGSDQENSAIGSENQSGINSSQLNTISSQNSINTNTASITGSNKIPYLKPAGAFNYMNYNLGIIPYYDFKGTISNNSVSIPSPGGPMYINDVIMDLNQSYVVRTKVSVASTDSTARIIFKGKTAWDHLYMAIQKNSISIYDAEPFTVNSNIIGAESRYYTSPKLFTLKANTAHDVIILTSPGKASVWIDGILYIDNLDLNNGMKPNPYYLRPGYISTKKESRFINNINILGVYINGGTTASFSSIEAYYTQAGMDKNYIDDGVETNFKSTWKQNEFIISAYSSWYHMPLNNMKSYMSLLKAANVNLVIPVSFPDNQSVLNVVKACNDAKLNFLASDWSLFTNSPLIQEDKIKAFVDKVKSYEYLYGYYVWDEPLTNHFWKVRKTSQLLTKYDPSNMTLAVLLPSYGPYKWTSSDAEMRYNSHIGQYMSKVKPQILSTDFYPFSEYGQNINLKTSPLWKDMGYLRNISLSNKSEYWHVFQGIADYNTSAIGYINPARIKVQMNAALAYGASGVSYFMGSDIIVDNKGVKSQYYDELTQINKEVRNVGNLLMKATSSSIYHSAVSATYSTLNYLDSISSSTVISSLPSTANIIVGVFTAADNKIYLAVSNKDFTTSATGTITLKKNYNIATFNANTNAMGSLASANSIPMSIEPGGIKVYQLN